MKTKTEIRDWLLENAIDEDGNLQLTGLDFGDLDGDVFIGEMIVKNSLYQSKQTVGGYLFQSQQTVGCGLYNHSSTYGGSLYEEPSTKALKKITIDELKEMGYEIEKGE